MSEVSYSTSSCFLVGLARVTITPNMCGNLVTIWLVLQTARLIVSKATSQWTKTKSLDFINIFED